MFFLKPIIPSHFATLVLKKEVRRRIKELESLQELKTWETSFEDTGLVSYTEDLSFCPVKNEPLLFFCQRTNVALFILQVQSAGLKMAKVELL